MRHRGKLRKTMSKYNAKDSSLNLYIDSTEEVMDARFSSEQRKASVHKLPSIKSRTREEI